MKKTFLLTIAFTLTINYVLGQTSTLKGVVINSKTSEKIAYCSVHLYSLSDTSKFTIFTDINGYFTFSSVKKSKYKLKVSVPDYFDTTKKIKLNKDTVDINIYVKQRPAKVCY